MQAVVSFALLLLAAVPSLQPFHSTGDQMLDPRIEGTWRVEDQTWTIVRTPQRSDYTLSINEGRGGFYTATLFKVNSGLYLDLKLQRLNIIDDEFVLLHMLRTHTLMRVELSSDTLRVAPMDNEKLRALMAQQPNAIEHVSMESNGVKPLLVLTASSAQLKTLIKTYGDRIFTRPVALQRGALSETPMPMPTAPVPGPLAPLPNGKALNSAQAALRAARVANDAAEKQFGVRPFNPANWVARFENNQWHWGQKDEPGVNGYSADVTMNRDGSEVDAKIYFSSSESTTTEVPAVPPPPAPILPRER